MNVQQLASYAQNYSGHLKIKRLLFIAEYGKSDGLRKNALKMAVRELKKGINTQYYKETCEKFKKLDSSLKIDKSWINKINDQSAKRLEELELEFNTYKTSSLKEKVRKASIALGEFYYKRGEFQNALKRFLRIRDYVSTPQHISEMCLLIIKASIELENYAVISQYLSRARQVCDASDKILQAKLTALSGLVEIHNTNYKQAARKFLSVNINIGDSFNEIISCRDIALYGVLLAIATFGRRELKSKESMSDKVHTTTLIDNSNFQLFLEYEPQIGSFAENFYNSEYSQFLSRLSKLKSLMEMDIYLRMFSDKIYVKIRNKALCQYVSPFMSIDLKKMAKAFDMNVTALRSDLVKLIQNKEIDAKIDSQKNHLYSRPKDQKSITFSEILDFGDKYVKDTENAILRMNMLKNKDFICKPQKKQGRGQGRGRGGKSKK